VAVVCDVRVVTILEYGYRVFYPPLLSGNWPIRTVITAIQIALIAMVTCYGSNTKACKCNPVVFRLILFMMTHAFFRSHNARRTVTGNGECHRIYRIFRKAPSRRKGTYKVPAYRPGLPALLKPNLYVCAQSHNAMGQYE